VRSIGPAVQRFARQPDADKQLVNATSRETKLDPFKARINQRWNEGITDACVLQARGWTGGVRAVRPYVRRADQRFHPAAAPPSGEPGPLRVRSNAVLSNTVPQPEFRREGPEVGLLRQPGQPSAAGVVGEQRDC
jgi:hypothetical protein